MRRVNCLHRLLRKQKREHIRGDANRMNRRELLTTLGTTGVTLATALPFTEETAEAQQAHYDPNVPPPYGSHPKHDMSGYGIPKERQHIAMLVYPNMNALDLVAPYQILCRMGNAEVHLIWKTRDLVSCDSDLTIQPTGTFADCPNDLIALFVPGGARGTADLLEDTQVLDFIAQKARTSRYITAVSTGSLLLGAAGLLKGYRATSHWTTRDMLAAFGAKPVRSRVVVDRNRVTAGGMTAGIDFALRLVALLRNEKMAQALTLVNEYDPQPPFRAGTLDTAPPAVAQMEWAMNMPIREDLHEAVKLAQKRLK